MCWMMVKPAGKQVNFKYMDKAQKHNEDGYGVAWYENGFVNTYKTFDYNQFKGIVAALKKHQLVIHLRHKTRGKKDYDSIHPFDIGSGVMFHNGTMKGLGSTTKSDSQELAERISRCDFKFIEDIEPLIEPYIDDNINRLVFFEDNGRVTIMNEDLGIWEDGVWYSNDYHLKDEGWCRAGTCTTTPNPLKEKEYLVFVYGTLKRGYSNNFRLLKDAVFLGKAKTKDKYTMIGKGMAFPYVLEKNNELGKNIVGEVYAVSEEELRKLDRLEGVPTHYKRTVVDCIYLDDNTIEQDIIMYVKNGFNKDIYDKAEIISEWVA